MANVKPPRGALAVLATLPGITPEQRRNVIEELDQRGGAHAFDSMQRAHEATAAGKSFDARNWTWAAGVATDKNGLIGDVADDVRLMSDIKITPEKGGVGPLTICALFDNVLRSARSTISGK